MEELQDLEMQGPHQLENAKKNSYDELFGYRDR